MTQTYTVEFTTGPNQEVIRTIVTEREFGNASELVVFALNALFVEKERRSDGSPTGYRIIDAQGRVLRDRPYA